MGLLKRRGGSKDGPALTLFHAADIHGADPCWRKFVGADGRFQAEFMGEVRSRQFVVG